MLQKYIALAIVLCVFNFVSSKAEHPTDPNAILLDSIHVQVGFHRTDDVELTTASGDAQIDHIVVVWNTSSGIDLVGIVGSKIVGIVGDTSGRPTPRDIFVALSSAAIDSAIARGHIPVAQQNVRVYQTKVIEEVASGSTLTYAACASGVFAMRKYEILWTTPPSRSLLSEDACSSAPPTGCSCIGTP